MGNGGWPERHFVSKITKQISFCARDLFRGDHPGRSVKCGGITWPITCSRLLIACPLETAIFFSPAFFRAYRVPRYAARGAFWSRV